MNIWPAKVITPTVTYEKCLLKTDLNGDVVIEHSRGMELARMAVADREDINTDARHYRYVGVDGEQWEVMRDPSNCACGGTVEYPTVATSQPA